MKHLPQARPASVVSYSVASRSSSPVPSEVQNFTPQFQLVQNVQRPAPPGQVPSISQAVKNVNDSKNNVLPPEVNYKASKNIPSVANQE